MCVWLAISASNIEPDMRVKTTVASVATYFKGEASLLYLGFIEKNVDARARVHNPVQISSDHLIAKGISRPSLVSEAAYISSMMFVKVSVAR